MSHKYKVGELVRLNGWPCVGVVVKNIPTMFAVKLIENHNRDLDQYLDVSDYLWCEKSFYESRATVYLIKPHVANKT